MQTGKSTVENIFNHNQIFHVPAYQRAYSWEEHNNLKDFLADLVNQHSERNYFLGSFLFHINGKRNKFTVIDIVDGQQRLTTFVIFINILIEKLISKSSKLNLECAKKIYVKDGDVFKLETSSEDSSFLHSVVLNLQNEQHRIDDKTSTKSQGLLLRAKVFFTKKLNEYDLETLEKIFITATNADVLLYVVDEINTATQVFELLNDRGKKLTDLESIKSFLMYNVGLVSDNPDQIINGIQSNFTEIYRLLEKYEINDRDVLRYHTIAFEKCSADYQEKPREFIKDKITLLTNNASKEEVVEEIQLYSSRLKDSFVIYSKIQEKKDTHDELSQLFMIGRIAPFYPVIMKIYQEQPNDFDRLVKSIKRFTFIASLVGLRSDSGESHLYSALRNDKNIVDTVDHFTSQNLWNINKRTLNAIELENYYTSINKNCIKYILFSYENYLRNAKGHLKLDIKDYFSSDNRAKLNIEHIQSQREKDLQTDDNFKERYIHSLGNLVLDSTAPNSSKNNKNTTDKINPYGFAPLMSQNEITQATNCNWKDVDDVKRFIEEREAHLRNFIKNNLL